MSSIDNWNAIHHTANGIKKAFKDAWKSRYGEFPPPFDDRELEVFDYLAETFGEDKGCQVVEAFLRIDMQKFIDDAHKPLLIKWNLPRVMAEVGRVKKREGTIKLQLEHFCNTCNQSVTLVISDLSVLDTYICPACQKKAASDFQPEF